MYVADLRGFDPDTSCACASEQCFSCTGATQTSRRWPTCNSTAAAYSMAAPLLIGLRCSRGCRPCSALTPEGSRTLRAARTARPTAPRRAQL